MHSRLHPCIQDASGQRDAAEQIAADRLPVFQLRIPIEYGGRVTQCSISSLVTAGLCPRPAYRCGRVSDTKVIHLHKEDGVKLVVIAVVDGVPLYIQNIPPVFCEHLSVWFQVSSKKWRLEITEFRSYCDIHIS